MGNYFFLNQRPLRPAVATPHERRTMQVPPPQVAAPAVPAQVSKPSPDPAYNRYIHTLQLGCGFLNRVTHKGHP